jgi:hypothetical protein
MVTTAGKVREMLAAMPDDAPVFADVWTAAELVSWIEDIEDAVEDDGGELDPIDLTDPDTLRRALQCIPDLWASSGDGASEEFQSSLLEAFTKGKEVPNE